MMERMNARVLVLPLHHNAIARSHCHDCILLIVCARSVSVSQPGLRGVSRCVAIIHSSGGPTGVPDHAAEIGIRPSSLKGHIVPL